MRVLREFDHDAVVNWLEQVDEAFLLSLAGQDDSWGDDIAAVDDDEQREIEEMLTDPDCWAIACKKTITLSS